MKWPAAASGVALGATMVATLSLAWAVPVQAQAPGCQFVLGFATLRQLVGPATVGQCLEDQQTNVENGDAFQRTSGGLLVWRKADNWTAFTDGHRTWVNGPRGLQQRLNTERYPWEGDAGAPGTTLLADLSPAPGPPVPRPPPAAGAPRVGTPYRSGNWEYTVNGTRRLTTLASNGSREVAKGEFVVVGVTVENVGRENFGLNSWDFELYDGAGVKYSAAVAFGADRWARENGYPGGVLSFLTANQIPPGVPIRYALVYDVTPGAQGLRLRLVQAGADVPLA